jgi:hypothetical protein
LPFLNKVFLSQAASKQVLSELGLSPS